MSEVLKQSIPYRRNGIPAETPHCEPLRPIAQVGGAEEHLMHTILRPGYGVCPFLDFRESDEKPICLKWSGQALDQEPESDNPTMSKRVKRHKDCLWRYP